MLSSIDKAKLAVYRLPETLGYAAVVAWVASRLESLKEDRERGDVSITTVIIMVALITLALAIAAVITVTLLNKYKNKLSTQ
ncbi:hypothetical protein [Streptomyces sp. TLI_171]|uniref:hypothetical protein n=1 Tax=Streptomyces sp. TLI_171 TaxID=1938859 RepID=UPI000C5C5CD5|nr:hypothetical protein [Streptomyces sp. TLI_171]RKE02970.1 hypothetical protein BX266_7574 [Streptomyces sp. TLI_171]